VAPARARVRFGWERAAAHDRAPAHRDTRIAASRADLEERRVTELYPKAVAQLGSDKGAGPARRLYALERLGQEHPQRQTIVNVLSRTCGCLSTARGGTSRRDASRQRAQKQVDYDAAELQVRLPPGTAEDASRP